MYNIPLLPFRLTSPPPPKEHDVSHQISEFLERQGWYVVRNHVGTFVPRRVADYAINLLIDAMRTGKVPDTDAIWKRLNESTITMGEKGMADLLIVHPEHAPLWCEIKRPGLEMNEHQAKWANDMTARGFMVGCFDSYDKFIRRYRFHCGADEAS